MSLLSLLSRFRALARGLVLMAGVGVTPSFAHDYTVGTLKIDHPWARATPAGARVAGGFLTIRNVGAADKLIGGSSAIAGRVEVHEMVIKDGVMTMRQLAGGLSISENAAVELKPGSYHVMFMDLKQPLKVGDTFTCTLTFERAGTVDVEFAVKAMGAYGQMDHGAGHQHGTMPPKS